MVHSTRSVLSSLFLLALFIAPAGSAERTITIASTTSTEQSGFFAHVLPLFESHTGIAVRVIAVGSGQALAIGEHGDADALLVHDPVGEEMFMDQGHGVDRRPVMFNDFLIVGPRHDPAGIRSLSTALAAMRSIAAEQAIFASRGDDSGTHRAERRLWTMAGVTPNGSWYRELGQGMGPTLKTAAELGAYLLTDRATWASFTARGELAPLLAGDPALFNPYSSILVNPAKSRDIKAVEARRWHEWLTLPAGRSAIESFRIGGEQVFFLPRSQLSN